MFQSDKQLIDTIRLEDWQEIQDSLSDVLEITLRTFSPDGKLYCRPSRPLQLCDKILHDICSRSSFPTTCLFEPKTQSLKEIKETTHIKCPFGLSAFLIPIMATKKRSILYLVVGPVIFQARKAADEYAEEARDLGLRLNSVMDELVTIKVLSYNKGSAITCLLKRIFSHIAQTGYHKKRLGEIAPEVVELDPLFSRYYEEKILNSLLSSCTLALNADSGSVMTVDQGTSILHIKAASKLDDEVVNNTNLKVGDGIAGVAAATSEPIILPKDKDKRSLSGKMKRQYIKSSMIVPFKKANNADVYGVINLNVVRKDIEFSKRDIELVKNLVDMVSVALVPLRQAKNLSA